MKPFFLQSFLFEKGVVMPVAESESYVFSAANLAALVMYWRRRRFCSNETNSTPSFIMMPAVALSHLSRFTASFAMRCKPVFGHVIFVAFHYLQVLRSVVEWNPVNVMNPFRWLKATPNLFFCNQNVLKDSIVVSVSSRVSSIRYANIASSSNRLSALVKGKCFWVFSHVFIPARSASRSWFVVVIADGFSAIKAFAVEVNMFCHTVNLTTGSMDCKTL